MIREGKVERATSKGRTATQTEAEREKLLLMSNCTEVGSVHVGFQDCTVKSHNPEPLWIWKSLPVSKRCLKPLSFQAQVINLFDSELVKRTLCHFCWVLYVVLGRLDSAAAQSWQALQSRQALQSQNLRMNKPRRVFRFCSDLQLFTDGRSTERSLFLTSGIKKVDLSLLFMNLTAGAIHRGGLHCRVFMLCNVAC